MRGSHSPAKTTPDDEAITIYWRLEADGSITTGPTGLRAVELGSHALALELIQTEVDDEVRGANTRFLYDPKNLDYLKTEAGPLSDLFARSKCTPKTALHAAGFMPMHSPGNATDHDTWDFDTTVDCRMSGARYCTDGGALVFKRQDQGTWHPATACASVLVDREPADFMKPSLKERSN